MKEGFQFVVAIITKTGGINSSFHKMFRDNSTCHIKEYKSFVNTKMVYKKRVQETGQKLRNSSTLLKEHYERA